MLVIRDLRIYVGANDGKVLYYRDSRGVEADTVVERAGGTWGAFEVKLGIGAVDVVANNFLSSRIRSIPRRPELPPA